ncbi:hypothetical protein GF412_02520 [Candidatus Micrarchaeota archaeon]|nr:hypothetical protein [Candidatus Micrarchaeota archaeon]MBD3417833.1 hypothetical protein [Candidatus Micrarchaeota archaeon]
MGIRKKLDQYEKITGMSELARRYFVMNSFDGTLTIFGVLLGSFLAQISEPATIIMLGMAGGAAIFVSGVWGTYLSESAERKKSKNELEKVMLKDLDRTKISEAENFATYYVSFINGISPLLAILLIISPFFAASAGIIGMGTAYYISFALFFVVFASIGVFLGRLSKENLVLSALKSLAVGFVCAIIIYAISSFTAPPI